MPRPSFAWASPTLTRIGKRFGFDAHYIAKSTALVSLSYAISVMKGLITGYLVTRLFPPTMYGEYKFVLGVVGTVGFIGLPGLSTSLATAIARKEQISLARIAKWCALIAGVGSIAILLCIPFLAHWGRLELWPLFLIAALAFAPGSVSTNLFSGIIRGASAFDAAFRASLITNVTVTLTVLAMLLIQPSSLLLLTFTSAIPAVVYLCMLIPYERKYRSPKSQRPLLMRALGLSIATIPTSASWYIDSLLITAFFGLNQLALFSVALLIPEQVKIWTKELFPIIFAKQASGKDSRGRRRKMHLAVIVGMAVFAVGILCYVLVTPYLIPFLFPLYPAKDLILLTNVAALTLIVAPATIYPQFLEARGMVRAVHWSNWIASGVFVLGLVSLIPTYGPMGAVIARGLFRVTNALVAFILVQRTPVDA